MQQTIIPHAIFDALTDAPAVFDAPTCACFLAIDAGLPSQAARVHLRYLHHVGKLVRVDLREVARDNPAWAGSILRSSDELQRLMSFPGQLPVYVGAENAFRDSFHEGLDCLLQEMSFMLAIWERVLHCDGPRLNWIFQASVPALRRVLEARGWGESYPFGRLGKFLQARSVTLDEPTKLAVREYLGGVFEGKDPWRFEGYRAFLTTQLRVLFHLALAVAPEVPWCDKFAQRLSKDERHAPVFHEASPRARASLLDTLSEFLTEALECPAAERPANHRNWLGQDDFDPPPNRQYYEGDDDWVRWAMQRAKSDDLAFVDEVLGDMNPAYHTLESVLELADSGARAKSSDREKRLQALRRSWVANLRQGPRTATF